jgi:hypothetical protein
MVQPVMAPASEMLYSFKDVRDNCPGCHNMGTSAPEGGREIEIADLVSNINKEMPMRRFTIIHQAALKKCSSFTDFFK